MGNAEIRFQNFRFEANILRCQNIRNAYYSVPMLHCEEKIRVHLCKRGSVVCRKREDPYMQHNRWC